MIITFRTGSPVSSCMHVSKAVGPMQIFEYDMKLCSPNMLLKCTAQTFHRWNRSLWLMMMLFLIGESTFAVARVAGNEGKVPDVETLNPPDCDSHVMEWFVVAIFILRHGRVVKSSYENSERQFMFFICWHSPEVTPWSSVPSKWHFTKSQIILMIM